MRRKGEKEKSGGGNKVGRVCSITGTVLIVAVIILCSLLVLPGIFGFHMYHVISGSMEPAVPVGSLLYVRGGQPEEVEEDRIIAFYSSSEDGGVITHRVVKNNVVSGTFVTKGDANEKEDPTLTAYADYIGEVVLTVPYMGKLLTLLTSLYGKISAGCMIGIGVVLNLIGGRMGEV